MPTTARIRNDLGGGSSENRSRIRLAKANRQPVQAVVVAIPEIKPRSSIPGKEISRRYDTGIAVGGFGGHENRMLLKWDPFNFVFGS